jgi:DNA-binding phage protein
MALQDPPLPDPTPPAGPPAPVTLAALARASGVLSLTAVAQAAGIPRQTLFTRLRRGRPELTAQEALTIAAALEGAGLAFRAG